MCVYVCVCVCVCVCVVLALLPIHTYISDDLCYPNSPYVAALYPLHHLTIMPASVMLNLIIYLPAVQLRLVHTLGMRFVR